MIFMEPKKKDAKRFTVYTDGAARGNPGPSASGFAVVGNDEKIIGQKSFYNGIKTNNFAEYNAIIKALEWCEANIDDPEHTELDFVSDSELVVRQLNGKYKIRSEDMRKLNETVRELAKWFESVKFHNERRSNHGVSAVDAELNALLDSRPDAKEEKF